ncbi:MAG: hypothetical protein WAL59_03565, partial [Roseiarcus sp.]
MRRKLRMGWREAHEFLTLLLGLLSVAPLTVETHELGLDFAERYGLSRYDGMIQRWRRRAAARGFGRRICRMRIGAGLR